MSRPAAGPLGRLWRRPDARKAVIVAALLVAWELATRGSARVLGMADALGVVAPGYKADLVLLHADSVFLRPLNHALNALVYVQKKPRRTPRSLSEVFSAVFASSAVSSSS